MKLISLAVAAALAMSGSVAKATTYAFTTLSDPSATGAAAYGPSGTFGYGVNNNGQAVGLYSDTGGYYSRHGFVFSGGTYTSIDAPGTYGSTFANGINNSGKIVGGFEDLSGILPIDRGYIDANGTFTILNAPGAVDGTTAYGINSGGTVVGVSEGPNFSFDHHGHGFIYTGGTFTPLDVPESASTDAEGINDSGRVVGTYADAANQRHGYLYSEGSFTDLSVSGARWTYASGINNGGEIVGFSLDFSGNTQGFVYSGGTFTTLEDIPGGTGTIPVGINDSGQLIGYYVNADGQYRGFIATPVPIPPATFLFPSALALLGFRRRDVYSLDLLKLYV